MLSRGLVPSLVLMLSLFSSAARAEFGAPYITPSPPVAGEQLLVNVPIYQIEYCDAIVHVGDYPIVSREGNTITILFNGIRYGALGEWCIYPPGTATHSFGAYSLGSYTLVVQLRYANKGGDWIIDTLGVVPFTVAPTIAETVAVPTWGRGFAIVCIVLLSFLGALVLRRRRGPWDDFADDERFFVLV